MVEARIHLANSAETVNGLLYVLGLGWTNTKTPLGPIALIAEVTVPWDETNRQHLIKLSLVDADGRSVVSAGSEAPLEFQSGFVTGRPPGLTAGADQTAYRTFELSAGLALPPGTYEWRINLNGQEVGGRTFSVVA